MPPTIEAELSKNARVLTIASQSAVGEGAREVEQRAEGEFLRKLIAELQPMLRESMRSHRIFLASDAYGKVMLKSDGTLVHVDIADQEDALAPLQVMAAEPSLLTLLDRIEAELVAANDPRAKSAAEVIRLARTSLRLAAAT